MALPIIRTDFNTNSLANTLTLADLQRTGLGLFDGMRCVFYDLDAQDNEIGFLHSAGTVWWDAASNQFRIDLRTLDLRFTPGEDLALLDSVYAD